MNGDPYSDVEEGYFILIQILRIVNMMDNDMINNRKRLLFLIHGKEILKKLKKEILYFYIVQDQVLLRMGLVMEKLKKQIIKIKTNIKMKNIICVLNISNYLKNHCQHKI